MPAVTLGECMKTKYWIVAVFAAAVLVAGLAWSLDTGLIGGKTPTAGSDVSSREAEASSSNGKILESQVEKSSLASARRTGPVKTGASASTSRSHPGSTSSRHPAANGTRPSWNPQPPASKAAGLEMPTKAPSARTSLPKSKDQNRALASKPPTGESAGKLTSGFPIKAVPHPKGTAITSSAVSAQGKRVLVSFEGRTKTSPSKVIAFYAKDFAAKGWASTPSSPQAGEPALQGGYKGDSVVVTTRKLPTGQTAFVVAGAFTVGG